MKVVIRAGGSGTRLYPLSSTTRPKQCIPFFKGKSLLELAYERALLLTDHVADIFVSCDESQEKLISSLIPVLSTNIIREIGGKNTGIALCVESIVMNTRASAHEAIVSIPSDDFITNTDVWVQSLIEASAFVQENPAWMYTPTAVVIDPPTGFSYVKGGEELTMMSQGPLMTVSSWIEKPSREMAFGLIEQGYAAHMGAYVYASEGMISAFSELHPEVLQVCQRFVFEEEGGREEFLSLEPQSIESMITKHIPTVCMSQLADVGWTDVGRFSSLRAVLGDGGNVLRGNIEAIGCHDVLISAPGRKKVQAVGLSNISVIDTGEVLFLVSDEREDLVKELQK